MQQLLREPEDRLGSQAASSTIRPNSQIVNARRSVFLASTPGTSNDGADLIKVRLPAGIPHATLVHGYGRLTPGSVESTGSTSTDILRHIARNSLTQKIPVTSMTIFLPRSALKFILSRLGVADLVLTGPIISAIATSPR